MSMCATKKAAFTATAAALVAFAGGCGDRSSDADQAIRAQALEMHALSADSPSPAMSEVQQKVLTGVNKELASHATGGSASEKAAASMLMAQAHLGLAEQSLSEAAAAERLSGALVSQANAYLTQWRMRQAVRVAAESVDISKELTEIAKAKQEKDTAAADERRNRAALQARLDDFRKKAKEKNDAMSTREADYGRLMEEASRLSATDGISKVEQANGIRREADMLRMLGTKLDAQAGELEPQVRELDAIVSQWENQKKDLEATEASLAAHLQAAKAEAAEAGRAADEVGQKLSATMTELAAAHADADAAYDKAQALFSKAVQAAREAAKESPTAGKALLGDAYLAAGINYWQKSQGLRGYAALLQSLASVQPPLRDSASYAAKAKEMQAADKTAVDAAAEALGQAKSAFESISGRVSGAGRERMEELARMLESAAMVVRDEGTATSPELAALAGGKAPPAVMTAPEAGSSPTPEAGTADASGPKAALASFLAASKASDQNAVMAMIDMPEAARKALMPMTSASQRVDKAFRSKFGMSFAEAMSQGGGMGAMAGMSGMNPAAQFAAMQELSADDFSVQVNGDTASATAASAPDKPLTFKNVNGKWLLSMPELTAAMSGPQAAMMTQMSGPISKAMESYAAMVESGKYPDAAAAVADFQNVLQSAIMGGMKPQGGGG